MAAQLAWLNAISDNIANVSTVGYKQASTEFSSLALSSGLTADYQLGSLLIVDPCIAIDGQGALDSDDKHAPILRVKGTASSSSEGPE